MMITEDKIVMADEEWKLFQKLTEAPWKPRTKGEFDAMAELGAQYHLAQNTEGVGVVHALASRAVKFGPNGEVNFPINQHKMDYIRFHGEPPATQAVLDEFVRGQRPPEFSKFVADVLKPVDNK